MNDLIIQTKEASVTIKASEGTHEMHFCGDLQTLIQYARDTTLDGYEGQLTEQVTITFTRPLPSIEDSYWFVLSNTQDEVSV